MGAILRKDYLYEEPEGETTLDEFLNYCGLPNNRDKTFELIDGYIVMMAGNATGTHQRICAYFVRKIGHYLEGKKCEVLYDLNVYLFHENIGKCKNVFQPDIMIGCDRDKVTNKGYEGTPEFIIEVISPSTSRMDYFVKCDAYMRFGVKEYWIVDFSKGQIIVYISDDAGAYKIYAYTFNDVIPITVLDDFSIDFNEIIRII